MSPPQPRPWQRDLEDVLRRELRKVAEFVEPSADGLDRIRSRIGAQHRMPSGWIMANPAGSAIHGRFSVRNLQSNLRSIQRAAQAFFYTGVHRFGPSEHKISWHRWLRPIAALATGIFIVLAGSWAVTALPQIIASSGDSSPHGAGTGRVPVRSTSGSAGSPTRSQQPVTGPGHSNPAAYPPPHHGSSARGGSPPAPSPAPSVSTPPSASPAPSPTSSPTTSPSASPTSSMSCSPSPSPSPAASGRHVRKPHCRKPPHHRHRSQSSRSAPATIGNRDVVP